MRPRDQDATTNFFQTELGKTLRIDETDERAISVDILKDNMRCEAPRPDRSAPRLSPGSRTLTATRITSAPRSRFRTELLTRPAVNESWTVLAGVRGAPAATVGGTAH